LSRGSKNHAGGALPELSSVVPERRVTSYRIDPLISRSFKESCSKVGHSTCGVLEAFMWGFNSAVAKGDYHEPRPLTVNLTMVRQVQRVHRRGVERIYEELPKDLGDPSTCFMCGREAVYHGVLQRPRPQVPAYVCGDCCGVLDDLKGFRVEKVKNVGRTWVPPGDPSL